MAKVGPTEQEGFVSGKRFEMHFRNLTLYLINYKSGAQFVCSFPLTWFWFLETGSPYTSGCPASHWVEQTDLQLGATSLSLHFK